MAAEWSTIDAGDFDNPDAAIYEATNALESMVLKSAKTERAVCPLSGYYGVAVTPHPSARSSRRHPRVRASPTPSQQLKPVACSGGLVIIALTRPSHG